MPKNNDLGVFSHLYSWYVVGRNMLGIAFKRHRTYEAFAMASRSPVRAWRKAIADNRLTGNPNIPVTFKVLLEVLGVLLLALYGVKHWRLPALLSLFLLSQTASEQDSGGGSSGRDNSNGWDEEGAQQVR